LLREQLAHGPVRVVILVARAKELGISESTLGRAKDQLGITSSKLDFDGGRAWGLPESEHNPVGKQAEPRPA
jgi:hypothetical protein